MLSFTTAPDTRAISWQAEGDGGRGRGGRGTRDFSHVSREGPRARESAFPDKESPLPLPTLLPSPPRGIMIPGQIILIVKYYIALSLDYRAPLYS